ncbi:MAG: hypothetical protein JKY27_12185 [Magnetovibrio sp.]|nr:hypothetical protein [Magnetovibrio sp.]
MRPTKESKSAIHIILGAAVLSMGLMALPAVASAQGPTTCASRDKVVEALKDVYAEKPVSLGLTDAGAVIEVMASQEGSFTIVITHPNGLTCPIAAGKAWQSITAKLNGEGA